MSVKPILFLIITIPEKKYTYAGTVSKYIKQTRVLTEPFEIHNLSVESLCGDISGHQNDLAVLENMLNALMIMLMLLASTFIRP